MNFKKQFLLSSFFVVSSFIQAQDFNVDQYYTNLNTAIKKQVNAEKRTDILDVLVQNPAKHFFQNDIQFYYDLLSYLSTHTTEDTKKYSVFASNFTKRKALPSFLVFDNPYIDLSKEYLKKDTSLILQKENYLLFIIELDGFVSRMRFEIKKKATINKLFENAAENTLNIFEKVNLPTRMETDIWDNGILFITFAHNLNYMSKEKGERFLNKLYEYVLLGDFSLYEYARLYDIYFRRFNNGYSFFGTSLILKNNVTYLDKIIDLPNVNARREKYNMVDLATYCKFKNIHFNAEIKR